MEKYLSRGQVKKKMQKQTNKQTNRQTNKLGVNQK